MDGPERSRQLKCSRRRKVARPLSVGSGPYPNLLVEGTRTTEPVLVSGKMNGAIYRELGPCFFRDEKTLTAPSTAPAPQ
jgi:hypothetical protein